MTDQLSNLRSALGTRYAIERELGRGGMATVYLAMDLKHHRHVALKVLHAVVTFDLPVERFMREIEIAAKLNHPNILPLLDSGDVNGLPYYAMPYVEGKSLRDRLEDAKQLPVADAIRITREVADALAYAHDRGVVHRDIKPENILFQADHALLADFGISRPFTGAGGRNVTEVGMVIGTPAYMSPEQATAEAVDGRSDIYGLGCVLFEMLAGHPPPFAGAAPVRALRASRDGIPPELEGVIGKALATLPVDRFATAAQLGAELSAIQASLPHGGKGAGSRRWTRRLAVYAGGLGLALLIAYGIVTRNRAPFGRSDTPARPILAVLPFANLGPPDDEYFADGVTEQITSRLAGLSGLGVISRTSAAQYKATTKQLREIGRELGADYILEGTIRWEKDPGHTSRVRITPRLIRVRDDTHVWAHEYDSTLSEVFALQSAIANGVAGALDIALLAPERRRLETKPTNSLEAYDFYLRGNDAFGRGFSERDLRLALRMYERATTVDPTFSLAWAMQSRSHSDLFWSHYDATKDRLARAKAAADQALRLSPDLAEGHLALGYYYYYEALDYERALQEFATAALAEPNNGDIAEAVGYIRRRQGRWPEAAASLEQAVTLDPRSYSKVYGLAQAKLWLRQYPEAQRWLDRAIVLGPDQGEAYVAQAMLSLAWQGDSGRAGAALDRAAGRVDAATLTRTALLISGGLPVRVFAARFGNLLGRLSARSFGAESEIYFLASAVVSDALGQHPRALAHYDSARIIMEPKARAGPTDYYYHMLLGLADAALGRRDAATRESRTAAELLPRSKDSPNGTNLLVWLAQIDVLVGDNQAAIERLTLVLGAPHWLSPRSVKADPIWTPLRNDAAFASLLNTAP